MGRWAYGKDGQKQWRNFDIKDLKFNMRLFELWKRMEAKVMGATKLYQKMPAKSDPLKRKRKRGRQAQKKKKKGAISRVVSSSSASESPMKRVVFDLTAFSDDEDEPFEVRVATEDEATEDDEDDIGSAFESSGEDGEEPVVVEGEDTEEAGVEES